MNNIDDLLNLEKIDVAIVQGDVLEAFAANPPLYAELSRKCAISRRSIAKRSICWRDAAPTMRGH